MRSSHLAFSTAILFKSKWWNCTILLIWLCLGRNPILLYQRDWIFIWLLTNQLKSMTFLCVIEIECANTDLCGRTQISKQQTQQLKWIVLLGVMWLGIVNIWIIQTEVFLYCAVKHYICSHYSIQYLAFYKSEDIIRVGKDYALNEHQKTMYILTSLSVDEILRPRYMNWSINFWNLPFNKKIALFSLKHMNSVLSRWCKKDLSWADIWTRSTRSSV